MSHQHYYRQIRAKRCLWRAFKSSQKITLTWTRSFGREFCALGGAEYQNNCDQKNTKKYWFFGQGLVYNHFLKYWHLILLRKCHQMTWQDICSIHFINNFMSVLMIYLLWCRAITKIQGISDVFAIAIVCGITGFNFHWFCHQLLWWAQKPTKRWVQGQGVR